MAESKPLLTDAQYELLKRSVQYVLPALGAFYSAIAILWGLPYGEQVVGTFAALATLGGVIIGISKRSYNNSDAKFDGDLVVDTKTSETPIVRGIEGKVPLQELVEKSEVTLKIQDQASSQE